MTEIAIVMDMDGLMVDSEPSSRRAWDQVLYAYGHTLNDAVYNSIIGYRIDESAAILTKEFNLPVNASTLIQDKADALENIRANGVPPMPGLYELHSSIKARGIVWGVATSSPRQHAEEILGQLGLRDSCKVIAGGDEVSHGKPAPDIYLLAAERLGIAASRCLAVEDSYPGCRAALAAGMMVVAVPNGDTKRSDFSDVDHVFTSLLDVADSLEDLLAELSKRTV